MSSLVLFLVAAVVSYRASRVARPILERALRPELQAKNKDEEDEECWKARVSCAVFTAWVVLGYFLYRSLEAILS